jgi:hypothetical protein
MHNPYSYGGWGGKRSEVEIVLDSRSGKFDAQAWFLHKLNQERQGGGNRSSCGCNGGCERCWTPATSWFDYHRASLSFWKDIWDGIYGRMGCEPRAWPPGCYPPPPHGASYPGGYQASASPSDCAGKLIIAVKAYATAQGTFHVVNPTTDTVELAVSVDGFWDSSKNASWVTAAPKDKRSILGPGEVRDIEVLVDATSSALKQGTYEGTIFVKTPFTKRVVLEVQIAPSS